MRIVCINVAKTFGQSLNLENLVVGNEDKNDDVATRLWKEERSRHYRKSSIDAREKGWNERQL
jgi:hypothetical protein